MDTVVIVADQTLTRTVDKILDETEDGIIKKLEAYVADADSTLIDSIPSLEQEYDRIISDGNKEAEKIEKQIVGSADLEARNQLLLLVEESIDKVFQKAIEKIKNTDKNEDYSKFVGTLLDETSKILGGTDFTIYTNDGDQSIVQSLLSGYPGAVLAPEKIDCMGGIRAVSRDGSMTFDNTIDARFDRLKPLIRKRVASKFGLGN